MIKHIKFLLLAILMFTPLAIFAQTEEVADLTNPAQIVSLLTPFIVYIVVELIKLIKPILPTWTLGLLVPVLSAAAVYVTNLLGEPDVSWIAQFGLGLSATFLHQLKTKFSTTTTT